MVLIRNGCPRRSCSDACGANLPQMRPLDRPTWQHGLSNIPCMIKHDENGGTI